ncbi:MAG: ABC transporter ATP-binding protein [Acidimicrobiales bacterium]|nr:ABC transporter ATP-binding protein [Acidimicrobiales bacterium]
MVPMAKMVRRDQAAAVDRVTLKRAWGFAKPYRAALVMYLLTILLTSVIAVAPALIFKRLIDQAIPNQDLGYVNLLFGLAVGAAIAETAIRSLSRWFGAHIGEGLIFDLRMAMFERGQQLPLAFFTRTQTGALLNRMSSDVVGAQATVGTLATVWSDLSLLATVLVAMVLESWKITLASLMIMPLLVVIDKALSPRIVALSRQRMQLQGTMSSTIAERFNVSGALLVKLFGRRKAELDLFAATAGTVRDTGVTLAMTSRLYYASLSFVGALGTAAVYWIGARSVINGSLTVGALVSMSLLVSRLYSPLTNLASARVDLLGALVSFERCFEILDAPLPITDAPDATPLVGCTGALEFRDVRFRYPAPSTVSVASLEGDGETPLSEEPSAQILHGISFTAKPGELVALVGPSGAGKTTISNLIPRLYDVVGGAVLVDGRDVRSLTLESLRNAIGVVTQDPHLFHDTIGHNLQYARESATTEDIHEACRRARIHDLIASLPDGYDTVVGERGYRLSGGEKQRVAIARLLLKDPAIVILDEATSHLDAETEALVQEALADALAGRTAIVIAHRLSTIQNADQILVVDDGAVIERGTHTELLANGGLYADLTERLAAH